MDDNTRRLEAVLFASNRPIELAALKEILGLEDARPIKEWARVLQAEYDQSQRAFTIVEVAGGLQMVARQEYAPLIRQLYKPKAERLSGPALETLAIIAYRQPVTRSEMEVIRGVNVDGVIETLLEKHLIRAVGRKEALGRPILYGTTRLFLEHFGLNTLEELPKLPEGSQVSVDLSQAVPVQTTESHGDQETQKTG